MSDEFQVDFDFIGVKRMATRREKGEGGEREEEAIES